MSTSDRAHKTPGWEPRCTDAPGNNLTPKKEVVNADGTTTVVEEKSTTTNDPSKNPEPKKSGTRMAINEKGSGSTKVAPKKEAANESKTETQTTPTSKPQ